MALSSLKKMGAAVAWAGAVRAATETYQLTEEYTADNFLDKFDFFVSTYTSDDSWDLTHGYVQYLSQADAQSLGLVSTTSDGQIYIGPDTNSTYDPDGHGRSSVRMTSKTTYNQGLMIAKFSHMPVQACGAWPAFWSYGSPWLTMGEIDYFEGWNLMGYNRVAMHTNETLAGSCLLSESGISGTVLTQQCNNDDTGTGCGVQDDSGVWGSVTGATFAMQWTDEAIKIWSWLPTAVPSDVTAGAPDPSSSAWGSPTLLVEQENCDLAKSFADQQLVFDIDFCGDTAGSPAFWDATCSAFGDSCAAYVAENPLAFAETYFMVEGIQFYELGVAATTTTTSSSSSSSSSSAAAATSVSVASSTSSIASSSSSSSSPTAVTTSSSSTAAAATTTTSTSEAGGLLAGTGSVLDSTLGSTPTSDAAAVITSTHSHSTGYVYATSVSTDETGSETTIILTVDTTICPITAAEASSTSAAATASSSSSSSSSSVVEAQTTPSASSSPSPSPASYAASSHSSSSEAVVVAPPPTTTSQAGAAVTSHITQYSTSTLSATHYTTSTIFSTSASTITSCAPEATAACKVGDVTTVVVAVSTTICPVTATETGEVSRSTTYYLTLHSTLTRSMSTTTSSAPGEGSSTTAETASTSKPTTLAKTTSSAKAHHSTSKAAPTASTQQPATTEVISATDLSGALETATAAPTSVSLDWLTETAAAATGTGSLGAPNATVTGGASTTGGASAASKTSSCSGLDCIVVSSSGVRARGGLAAGGVAALVAGIAGGVLLLGL